MSFRVALVALSLFAARDALAQAQPAPPASPATAPAAPAPGDAAPRVPTEATKSETLHQTSRRTTLAYFKLSLGEGAKDIPDVILKEFEARVRGAVELKRFDIRNLPVTTGDVEDYFAQLKAYYDKNAAKIAEQRLEERGEGYDFEYKQTVLTLQDVVRIQKDGVMYAIELQRYQEGLDVRTAKFEVAANEPEDMFTPPEETTPIPPDQPQTEMREFKVAVHRVTFVFRVVFYRLNLKAATARDGLTVVHNAQDSAPGDRTFTATATSDPLPEEGTRVLFALARARFLAVISELLAAEPELEREALLARAREKVEAEMAAAQTAARNQAKTDDLAAAIGSAGAQVQMFTKQVFKLRASIIDKTDDQVRMRLGAAEGVGLDDGYRVYQVTDRNQQEFIGYTKVRKVGAGLAKAEAGVSAGDINMTELQIISDNGIAPGLMLLEDPRFGVQLNLLVGYDLLFGTDAFLDTGITIPEISGGGLTVGMQVLFNTAQTMNLGISEFYIGIDADVTFASQGGTDLLGYTVDLVFAKKFYWKEFALVLGAGVGLNSIAITTSAPLPAPLAGDKLTSTAFGAKLWVEGSYWLSPLIEVFASVRGRIHTGGANPTFTTDGADYTAGDLGGTDTDFGLKAFGLAVAAGIRLTF